MKALNYIFYGFFITMMLAIAGLLVASMLPIPGNIELKIVKSGSMEPTIPTGSLVVVKPMQSYGIGDVITFGADTKTEIPTTHRIIGFEADEGGRSVYRTKGDANEDPDANPVQRGEVIGKVVLHLPYVGFVLDFARQPLGFAMLIGVPAALVILEEVMTITREVKAGIRRRRNGGLNEEDGDDEPSHGGGGGTRLRQVAAERTVYLRKRAMDEIFVPMVAETRTWVRERLPRRADAYGSATLAVIAMAGVSTMLAGGAQGSLAYFNDIERSLMNRFAAAECDAFREGSCPEPFTDETPQAAMRVAPEESPVEVPPADEPEGEVAGASTEVPAESPQEPTETPVEEPADTSEEKPTDIPAEADVPEEPVAPPAPVEEPEDDAEEPAPEAPAEPAADPAPAPES